MITRPERHRSVVPARILTEKLFRRALRFYKILPVKSRYRAQTRNAVRDSDLCERDSAIRSRRSFFCTRTILGNPLLEPDERREVRLVGAHLLKESCDPRRCERRMVVYERRE